MADDRHILDCERIGEFDEINGAHQLCWVWCRTHSKFEWHSLPVDMANDRQGVFTTNQKPVSW